MLQIWTGLSEKLSQSQIGRAVHYRTFVIGFSDQVRPFEIIPLIFPPHFYILPAQTVFFYPWSSIVRQNLRYYFHPNLLYKSAFMRRVFTLVKMIQRTVYTTTFALICTTKLRTISLKRIVFTNSKIRTFYDAQNEPYPTEVKLCHFLCIWNK